MPLPHLRNLIEHFTAQKTCEDFLLMHFGAMWHSEPHQIIQLDVDLWEAMLKVIIIIFVIITPFFFSGLFFSDTLAKVMVVVMILTHFHLKYI